MQLTGVLFQEYRIRYSIIAKKTIQRFKSPVAFDFLVKDNAWLLAFYKRGAKRMLLAANLQLVKKKKKERIHNLQAQPLR